MIPHRLVPGVGRALVVLLLVSGIVMFGAVPSTGAVSKYARITIHKAECPATTTGDIFAKCHDNRVEGVKFTVYNPTGHGTNRWTDEDGVATFAPRAGSNRIIETVESFDTYQKAYVYCSDQNTGEVFYDDPVTVKENTLQARVAFQTSPGDVIVCDWYNLI
jgi:hypothetical protein